MSVGAEGGGSQQSQILACIGHIFVVPVGASCLKNPLNKYINFCSGKHPIYIKTSKFSYEFKCVFVFAQGVGMSRARARSPGCWTCTWWRTAMTTWAGSRRRTSTSSELTGTQSLTCLLYLVSCMQSSYTVKKGSRVSRPQRGCHYQTLPGRVLWRHNWIIPVQGEFG